MALGNPGSASIWWVTRGGSNLPSSLRQRIAALFAAGALVLGLGASPVSAESIVVDTLAGAAADDGACSLPEAIFAANTDSQSSASPGECPAGSGADVITFSVSGTIEWWGEITSELVIDGANAITVDARYFGPITITEPAIVGLADLTITGMSDPYHPDGGCIKVRSGATLSLTRSTISYCSAYNIWHDDGHGGGISNAGTLSVEASTVMHNGSIQGGGIYNEGTLTVTNSTISENAGGGIYNRGHLTVTNSTISQNGGSWATADPGPPISIPGYGIESLHCCPTIRNSIVAGNDDREIVGTSSTSVTSSLVGVPAGLTLADILDPAGLADNGGPTHTIALVLSANNPAIDAGDPAICAATPVAGLDQRGMPRPAEACDVGAYEAGPVPPSPSVVPSLPPSPSVVPSLPPSPSVVPSLPPSPSVVPSLAPSPSSDSGVGELTPPPTETLAEGLGGSAPLLPAILVLLATGLLASTARWSTTRRR